MNVFIHFCAQSIRIVIVFSVGVACEPMRQVRSLKKREVGEDAAFCRSSRCKMVGNRSFDGSSGMSVQSTFLDTVRLSAMGSACLAEYVNLYNSTNMVLANSC